MFYLRVPQLSVNTTCQQYSVNAELQGREKQCFKINEHIQN